MEKDLELGVVWGNHSSTGMRTQEKVKSLVSAKIRCLHVVSMVWELILEKYFLVGSFTTDLQHDAPMAKRRKIYLEATDPG